MATNFDDYFASRVNQERERNAALGISTKWDEVQQASRDKISALDTAIVQAKQRELAAKKSWVGQLELDPRSLTGSLVNLAASGFEGVARPMGDIAGFLAGDIPAMVRELGMSEEQIAAVGRHKQGLATPADLEIINRRDPMRPSAFTPLEMFDKATEDRQRSENINASFDRSENIHRGRRDELSRDLGENFQSAWDQVKGGWGNNEAGDVLTGMAKLVFNAGEAAITNPGAALEYIVENAPQLAVGAAGAAGKAALLTSNAGYASENYQKGLSKYQADNNGALPPVEERQKMAAYAASLAVAEQFMDTSLLKGAKGAADAARETARTGFVQSLKNVTKVGSRGAAGEALTEGYQTFAEGEASLSPVSAEQIYEGAVIGGIAGGGMAGGGRSLGELLKATPEHAAERAVIQSRQEAQVAAINTGDVTPLTDPKSPTYDPAMAVAALYGSSSRAEATPQSRQANLEEANEIVATLEAEREVVETKFESAITAKDEKTATKFDLELSKLDRRLEQSRENLARFNTGVAGLQAKTFDIDSAVKELEQPVDATDAKAVTARQAAGDSIINLSMAIPERLDATVALSMANNATNGLSEPQRGYLRAFSAARAAENQLKDMGKVSQEVYAGGGGNVGIAQYRERVAVALATGNKAQADKHLTTLAKFQLDHSAKAVAVAKAWNNGDGKGTQVHRTKEGSWVVATNKITREALRKSGSLEVNAPGLVTSIQVESDAITKALTELKAAYAVKFSSSPKGASNVKDVPQAYAPSATTAPQPEEAPVVGGTASDPSNRDGDGDGDGVKPESESIPAGGVRVAAPKAEAQPVADDSTEQTSVDSVSTSTQSSTQASPDAVVTAESKGQKQDTSSVTAKTAEETTSSESAEQTREESLESEVSTTGQLDVMGQKSPEGTAYNRLNLIAAYFSQSAGVDGDKTKRPLASVKKFLSEGWEKVTEFLPFDGLTDSQLGLLAHFKTVATKWEAVLESNLFRRVRGPNDKSDPRDFWFEDLIQFFQTENDDGKLFLEENVKTAMSAAAFSWIAENATRTNGNTDEEINFILGRSEDHLVSEYERDFLKHAGTRQNVVINALGQRVVQALGIKVNKDAPADLMPKLEGSLGAMVFKLLMDEKIVQRKTLTAEDMSSMTQDEQTLGDPKHHFIRLARDSEFKLHPIAEEIFKKSVGTQSVLDKLFSVEPGLKEPSLEPIPFTQKTTRNTNQTVPSKLAEILEAKNAEASFVRPEMYDLVQALDEDLVVLIAGGSTFSEETTHKANRPRIQAKNDGLMRELQLIKNFIAAMLSNDGDLAGGLYFDHNVWKQQRVGIATNVVNPQTSKIHRHMLYRKDWESKVDFSDGAQMENFYLRVAEGLGVKADKQSNEKSIAQYEKVIANPVIQKGVAVLRKRLAGADLSRSEQETLTDAVKKGGENFHSLSSLMALTQEANAREAGESSVTVRLMGEIDGVTNGPMLSNFLLGAADSVQSLFTLLNRGGFFQQGSKHVNFNLWRDAPGHFDLYETTAGHMTQAVQALIRNGVKIRGRLYLSGAQVKEFTDAIYGFTGTLAEKDGTVLKAGRNIIKTPLTAMVFGSSVSSAVDSMANKFIESIYAGIEDTVAGRQGSLSRELLVKNINTLLSGTADQLTTDTTAEELLEIEFSAKQIEAIKHTFSMTIGGAVATTMKTDFAVFIARRKQINATAQTAHAVNEAVYNAMRDETVKELVAKGEIAVNPTTQKPLHDMTRDQEAELKKRLSKLAPVLDTLFSKKGKSLRAGLAISKSGRKLSRRDTHQGIARFAKPFADGSKSTQTRGYEVIETDPGVAMATMAVHSLDSWISHMAAFLAQVLNIHDAHGTGLDTFEQTAKNLNQATWKALLGYSPAREMANALSRTVLGLADMVKEGALPPVALNAVVKAMVKIAKKNDIEDPTAVLRSMLTNLAEDAFAADDMKLQALETMQSIDQYALQGGQYEVTEQDRADASALRAGLERGLSKKEKEALDVIEAALQASKEEKESKGEVSSTTATSSNPQEPAATLIEEDVAAAKTESPFGVLGTPTKAGHPTLVDFFNKNPTASSESVIEMLVGVVDAGSANTRQFKRTLLSMLRKTMPKGVTVKVITADSQRGDVTELPNTGSFGWILGNEIYVLGDDFVNSAMQNPEVLLHELVHGALVGVVETELAKRQKNPKYTSPALKLVENLEELMAQAKAYMSANNITENRLAVSDLHEFIAYGMTHRSFQKLLADMKADPATKFKSNVLLNGFKRFINLITNMLFIGSDKSRIEQQESGLAALIENVSGLFNQGAKNEGQTLSSINLSQATSPDMDSDPVGVLNRFSTLDIHAALDAGDLSPEFSSKLRNLLGGIVEKLHGPFGSLKQELMDQGQQAMTPLDVWLKALDTGAASFASSVNAAPFLISEQEAFAMEQVEATVRAALDRNEVTAKSAYRELKKLFTEASKIIKPSDFATQEEYDFIFKIDLDAQNKSHHLARFAAFGLASEKVNKLLQVATATDVRRASDGKTFAERVQILFEHMLEFFHGTVTKTFEGQRADGKLNSLVSQLVDIEAKKRIVLAKRAKGGLNIMTTVDAGIKGVGEKGMAQVNKALNSQWVRKNKNTFIRSGGALARVVANDQVDLFMLGMQKFRDEHLKGLHGFAMGLMNDVKGPGKIVNALGLLSTNQQRQRRTVITHTATTALKAFVNGGVGLTKKAKEAISQGFLRTGMHHLLGHYNMAEIEQLVSSPAFLQTSIRNTEAKLKSLPLAIQQHFMNQANALAYFKMTGEVKEQMLMMSAHNIAHLYGTVMHNSLEGNQISDSILTLEQLVALYSIDYMGQATKDQAKEVLRTEAARTDGGGNGVDFILALHRKLETEAKARIFRNEEALMVHGYTPEIYNPNTEVKTATIAEGKELELAGYVRVGSAQLDPADPERLQKHIYVLKDGGLTPFQSGVFSYTGKRAKGTKAHSGYLNTSTADGMENAIKQASINGAKSNRLNTGSRPDLRKKTGSFMAPVLNPSGEIVNWRYLMNDKTKDLTMERDNRFEKILGALAGSIYDKETSTDVNKAAFEAMKEQYEADKALIPNSYVKVSPKAEDAELRNIWAMLPDDTKAVARAIWGSDGIYVRKDALTVMFGYRKFSLADMFKKEPDARGILEGMFVKVIEQVVISFARHNKPGMSLDEAQVYAKRAAVAVTKGERAWQELVYEVKDIIVVKTGVVLIGNILSNISLLMLQGVSLGDIVKHHLVALRGATAHHDDSEELASLQARIDTNTSNNPSRDLRRIAELKDSLERNPVKDLIEAGLMPTIAEDVVVDDDIYSYKSLLARKSEKFTKAINPTVLGVAKQVAMTHDTRMYQGLRRLTQVSDFLARYTLYQELTTRKNKPLSQDDAIFQASDSFVNYDMPMFKGMQYLDDMGFTMFTKYFLRIQRVLLNTFKEHPGRVLLMAALQNFVDPGPIVLDSGWIHKVGNNPLRWGAFQLPATIDDLATVSAAMALVK